MTVTEILGEITDIILDYNQNSREMSRIEVQYKRDALSTYITMLTDESAGLYGNWIGAEDIRKKALAEAFLAAKKEKGCSIEQAKMIAETKIDQERQDEADWRVAFYKMKEIGTRATKVLDSMASRLHLLDKTNND